MQPNYDVTALFIKKISNIIKGFLINFIREILN